MPPTEPVVLVPEQFRSFLGSVQKFFGSDLEAIVLPLEMKELITNAFLAGHITDLVSYGTDKDGSIQLSLAGTKAVFTDKLTLGRALMVVSGHAGRVGPNPVFPKTNGPGPEDNGGGTPVAMAA